MKATDKAVLDTVRPLLLEAIKLCESPDIPTATAALPAFTNMLTAANVTPDRFDPAMAAKGMFEFSAWGFSEGAAEPLQARSFFVEIRIQQSSGRTVSFCQVTDMTTDPESTAITLVEADWLKSIAPWISASAARYEDLRPSSPTEDETSALFRYLERRRYRINRHAAGSAQA